ncbi:hypothetical protein B0T18DRAFT_418126 [Schizothecium vesticola]|uniref:Uncharacterized protein n=1 Tax=Schizothecium vesticola TaxID=314040 RepID=A0AA40EJP6_9PEZI|nr:hypothetical protein B0T18DRAFT_418126 [Schizothecium vesticola]
MPYPTYPIPVSSTRHYRRPKPHMPPRQRRDKTRRTQCRRPEEADEHMDRARSIHLGSCVAPWRHVPDPCRKSHDAARSEMERHKISSSPNIHASRATTKHPTRFHAELRNAESATALCDRTSPLAPPHPVPHMAHTQIMIRPLSIIRLLPVSFLSVLVLVPRVPTGKDSRLPTNRHLPTRATRRTDRNYPPTHPPSTSLFLSWTLSTALQQGVGTRKPSFFTLTRDIA